MSTDPSATLAERSPDLHRALRSIAGANVAGITAHVAFQVEDTRSLLEHTTAGVFTEDEMDALAGAQAALLEALEAFQSPRLDVLRVARP